MIRAWPILVSLALAACNSEQSALPESNTAAAPAPNPEQAEVPSLEGEWRVTRIDGQDSAGIGMVAALGGGQASLATGCLRRAWTYTQKRNMLTFTPAPQGSTNCGKAPSALEETAYGALDQVNIAIFSADGSRADLSGTGGNLTLERR